MYYTFWTNNLLELKDWESWETLFNAAKITKFETVIDIAKNLGESDIPAVKYHRICRSLFTLKRDLQKLDSKNDKTFSHQVQIFVQVLEFLLHINVE